MKPLTNWTDRTRKTREEGDKIFILDPARMAEAVSALPSDAKPSARTEAGYAGLVASIYVRYPRDGAGTLRVVAGVNTPEGPLSWYESSAGGCGYDKLTAALAGLPLPLAGLTLGDHPNGRTLSGLYQLGFLVLGH